MTNPEIEPEAVEPVEDPTPAAEAPAEQSAPVVETPTEQPVAAVDETSAEQAAPAVETETAEETEDEEVEKDERKRRLLLLLLLLLLVCLCCLCGVIFRYWLNPEPLPNMFLPTQSGVCYKPTYKASIKNVDGPVSLAGSPDDQRIYVAEGGGERLVKMFDRDGNLLTQFAPPGTDRSNREPKYMAISPDGRVFLVDRTSSAIDIYDANGRFIDAIIGPHLTLSKFLVSKIGSLPAGTLFTHYEGINKVLTFQVPGAGEQKIDVVLEDAPWSPLGLRFDAQGNLIYTDTSTSLHSVHIIPAADLNITSVTVTGTAVPAGTETITPTATLTPTATSTPLVAVTGTPTLTGVNDPLVNFNPQIKEFGSMGSGNDQFSFPQTVVQDGTGNFYISDGNNSRISVWTSDMKYKTFFGFGSSAEGTLNLPRGTWMGARGCLHVADAVGSLIRVYSVSGGDQPTLAFEIGGYGVAEGQFNYPFDVFIDGTGRLYVADRANNRIQVWSY